MSTAEEWNRADVVIVGAGPVGSFLACLLGERGVRVRIVEEREQAPDRSMAIGVMPPSLSRFAALGLDHEIVAAGCTVRGVVVHDHARPLGRLDFENLPGPYPFVLSLPQRRLIGILWKCLRETNSVRFDTGLRAMALEQDAEGVDVRLERKAGGPQPQVVRGRFVVLCDGARGDLPDRLGVERPTRKYAPSFVMGDAPDDTGWSNTAHLFFTASGSVESFPMPDGRRRWVALADPTDPADVADQLARLVTLITGRRLAAEAVMESSRFTPEYRLASQYRVGRVILCGDAAHIMSPIGGLGMNVGLGDAWRLAPVLAALASGAGNPDGELARYERLRRRAFRHAARRAAAGMWLGTRTGATASRLRSAFVRHGLLRVAPIRKRLALFFSMWTLPEGADPVPQAGSRPFELDPKTHLDDPRRKRMLTAELFSTVAPRYDTVTRCLSFGRDRIWKDRLIAMLPPVPAPRCLDLACGTGDLTRRLAARYPAGDILGLDSTPAMIALARDRTSAPHVSYAEGDMGQTGQAAAAFDIVTGGYALRNAGDLDEAIAETYRVLKPGGIAAFLDFSKPARRVWQRIELRLLKIWGGLWGWIFHRNPKVYGYIADSLAGYPDRTALAQHYRSAGFTIQRSRLFCCGMIEVVLLRKPEPPQPAGVES